MSYRNLMSVLSFSYSFIYCITCVPARSSSYQNDNFNTRVKICISYKRKIKSLQILGLTIL